MSYWTRTVEPSREPVALDEAKRHMRVTFDDDDGMILRYLSAARQQAEEILSRSLITQTWRYFLDEYPATRSIVLPRPPVQSVTEIVSIEEDDTETTFAASNYKLADDEDGARIVLDEAVSWPTINLRSANGVRIEYVAGYGDSAFDVPWEVKQWILIRTQDLYENRESTLVGTTVTTLGFVDQLLVNHRNYVR